MQLINKMIFKFMENTHIFNKLVHNSLCVCSEFGPYHYCNLAQFLSRDHIPNFRHARAPLLQLRFYLGPQTVQHPFHRVQKDAQLRDDVLVFFGMIKENAINKDHFTSAVTT